jgi:hypothetical protein
MVYRAGVHPSEISPQRCARVKELLRPDALLWDAKCAITDATTAAVAAATAHQP